jgi:PAS domain S-box-containing protein
MKDADNKAGASGSSAVSAWFDTIAASFPPGELHLFSKDLRYLSVAHGKQKKRAGSGRFPANKSVFDIVDKKVAALILSNLEKVLHGETISFESEYKGSRYISHVVPMRNPTDGEMYILFHSTDVTELKEIEHNPPSYGIGMGGKKSGGASTASTIPDERSDLFFDIIPAPMFFTDAEGRIIRTNKALSDLTGYSEAEMRKLTIFDLDPGYSRDAWGENLSEMRRLGRLGRTTAVRSKDGHLIYGELDFTPTVGESRRLVHAIFGKTGDRDESEGLWQSEEKFRLISENVPDLIAVLDVKGRHVYVNPSYKSIISNPDTLLGKEVFDIVHPDDREKVKAILKDGLETGREQRIEFRLMAPDGSIRFVEARGKAVCDARGKLRNAVIVSRDVTEKKTVEEQYFRNQRIESLGTLAGGISHDLNNVLTPVILGVEALKRIQMDERGLAILKSISGSLSRGRDIVKQVLTFARGVEGGMMLIQPRHIVKEAVTLMKETFPKSLAIVENIPKALWLVNGDATRINQMLMNLGVNARDAMPEGGILYISAENIMIDEQFAVMKPGAKPGPYVLVIVQDTGVGMSREVKERIFEPFFTTKETGRGTGLGLSIVHTIVKSHGGFITVESEPGKSTTFKVYLPAVEVEEMEKFGEIDVKYLSGHGELLMVVDDEVSVCQITRQTLEAFGFRVVTATDGTEAVAIFAEKRNEVSLVVMDIAMPIMDGPRTIRALRKLNPKVKIIASSGIVAEDHLNLEDAAAPNAFLPKPYTAEKLLHVIQSVLKMS